MNPSITLIEIERPIDASTFQFLLQFAPPEKRERILRQRIKQNADTMVVGAALARYMIFKEFNIPLEKQHIVYGPYGKPFLKDFPRAYFNISHSGPFAACAVCDAPIGIDIQEIVHYDPHIACRVCAPEEIAHIEQSADPDSEFTIIWTQKEAWSKYVGIGINETIRNIKIPNTVAVSCYRDSTIALACIISKKTIPKDLNA